MVGGYDYKGKLISVAEALAKIKTNDCVISALGAAEPNGMLEDLHTIAPLAQHPRLIQRVQMLRHVRLRGLDLGQQFADANHRRQTPAAGHVAG